MYNFLEENPIRNSRKISQVLANPLWKSLAVFMAYFLTSSLSASSSSSSESAISEAMRFVQKGQVRSQYAEKDSPSVGAGASRMRSVIGVFLFVSVR